MNTDVKINMQENKMIKTISSIGILDGDEIRAILCGWNGDTMHDGSVLLNCWDSTLAVVVLVAMGDIISLGPNLESSIVAHRDRGVEWIKCMPRNYVDVHQWRRQEHYYGCGCFYLFDKKSEQWHIFDTMGRERPGIMEYKVDV
jgi:hypothetical protein